MTIKSLSETLAMTPITQISSKPSGIAQIAQLQGLFYTIALGGLIFNSLQNLALHVASDFLAAQGIILNQAACLRAYMLSLKAKSHSLKPATFGHFPLRFHMTMSMV